jgi:hypothetical protein
MRRSLLIFFLVLAVRAQEDVPPQYNFLVIVDTSISMAERKPAVLTIVRDLIRSGFSGQIEAGDSIDIWTADSQDRVERAPMIWNPARRSAIAAGTAEAIRLEKFRRGSHLAPVLSDLNLLLPNTRGALVVLVTDGEEPISEISLDLEINNKLPILRRQAARTREPIVISMIAIDGQLVDWKAYGGSERPVFARLPERPKSLPVAAAATPPEPIVPEVAKAPEPEQPLVLNYPPGAKVFAISNPAPAPPEITVSVTESPRESPITQLPATVGAPPTQGLTNEISKAQTNAPQTIVASITNQPVPEVIARIEPTAILPESVLSGSPPTNAISPNAGVVPVAAQATRASKSLASLEIPIIQLGVGSAGFGALILGVLLLRRTGGGPRGSLISRSLSETR